MEYKKRYNENSHLANALIHLGKKEEAAKLYREFINSNSEQFALYEGLLNALDINIIGIELKSW